MLPSRKLLSAICTCFVVAGCFAQLKVEVEDLHVAAITEGITHRVLSETGFSGGSGIIFEAAQPGQFVTYSLGNLKAGTYDVYLGVKKSDKRGILQFSINGAPIGAQLDLYAKIKTASGPWTAGRAKLFQSLFTWLSQ